MTPELFTHITVHADMLEEIITLENEVIAKLQMWTGFSPEKGVEKGGHFWHDGVSQAHINALL